MGTLYRRLAEPTMTFHVGPFRGEVARATILLGLILLFGALFRFAVLGRWSLWTDEVHTIDMARAVAALHERGPTDSHPPLYHIINSYLVPISKTEVWLRLPSALSSFLAILLAWKTGVVLAGRRLGLMTAALTAFSPLFIWYGREARMYGMAICFWAASVYFYIQSFRRGNWLDTFGLIASTLGALLLTYSSFGLWVIEISLVFIFWHLAGRNWWRLGRWLLAQAAIAMGFALWVPFLQLQLNRPLTFNWQLPFLDLSASLSQTLQLAAGASLFLILIALLASLIIITQPYLLDFLKRGTKPVALGLTLAYLLVLILSAVPRGLSIRRQLLVFLLPLTLAAAWAVLRLSVRRLPLAIVALAFFLSSYTFLGQPFEDWRGATTYLLAHMEEEDILFVHPSWSLATIKYYAPVKQIDKWNVLVESNWPGGEEFPFAAGTDIWVLVNDHPSMGIDTARMLTRFNNVGKLLVREKFPTYIEVYHYRVQ